MVGCATDSATSADPTTRRVVVAGAGLAGLTAALDLRDAGWDVVVLEARDRVGGRVHTLSAPFAPGLHAESGGESIDDNHDNILALIQRFGLQVEHRPVDKQQGGAVYYQNRRSKMKDFLQSPSGIVSDYTGFSLALLQLGLGLDPEHPEQFQRASMLDQRSLADFLKERHPITEAEFLIRTANQAGFASDLESVSLLFAVQQAVLVADVPDGATETMRVSGGNSKLVEAMASELGSRIRLQAPLTAVEQREGGVRVTAGGQTIDAAYLVLTMPPLPLRRVTFSPPLPAELAAAIAELELGPATKVISEYQHRFWEGAGLSGFTVSEQPFGVSWPATDSYASPQGLLSQFITGSSGLAAAQLDDATRIKQFQAQLDTVYPEGIPERTGRAATVAWSSDPLTGGGYTVYRPGQLLRFFPALRRGTPSIRFAGEHTEALAGYMESAVRSGHRVAHELGSAPPY